MQHTQGTRNTLSSLALVTLAAIVSSTAVADEQRYEMVYYDARPGGVEIATGDYGAAIARVARRSRAIASDARLVAATNLCVAYTAHRAFAQAEKSCSQAVALASMTDRSTLRRRNDSASAKALNNRGVVRALAGDAERAAADFRRASLLAGQWTVPERNSLVLATSATDEPAVAQSSSE